MQYVSILSPAFSGSTLLSFLLTSQPRSIGFGDTYFDPTNSPKHLCTCGRTFLECEPRAGIAQAIRDGGMTEFSWETMSPVPIPSSWPRARAGHWPLMASAALPAIRIIPSFARNLLFRNFYRENRLMLEYLAETGGYDFYFDGCKNINRVEFLRTRIRDLKLVHMVRHPGAIIYHDQRIGVRRVPERMALWAKYHRRSRRFLQSLGPESYIAVPYEKIVQDPEYFLTRIANFLGMNDVASEPQIVDRSKVHILGNRMRETVERIIDFSNTWREHVPADDQEAAEKTFEECRWAVEMYDDWNVKLEAEKTGQ